MKIRHIAREIAISAALVLASTGLLLGGMEWFLRARAPQVVEMGEFVVEDPELGFVLGKNRKIYVDGQLCTWVNSWGMRDEERNFNLPRTRLLGMGDSQTYGIGVPQNHTYLFQLEQCLNSTQPIDGESQEPIEVVNAGIGAYSTAQELLYLERLLPLVRPRLVMLGCFVGNDIDETINQGLYSLSDAGELVYQKDWKDYSKKDFTLSQHTRLGRFKSWLSTHSHTYAFLRNHIKGNLLFARPFLFLGLMAKPTGIDLYVDPPSERYEYGYQITEVLLGRMKDTCQSYNASFLVVLLPTKEQVYSEKFRRLFDLYNPSSSPRWSYPTNRLLSICQTQNIEVLDLLPVFRELAKEKTDLYLQDRHYSKQGHMSIAASLCEHLTREPRLLTP